MPEQISLLRPDPVYFDHFDHTNAGRLHEVFHDLRARSPIEWCENYGGFWIVTGYKEIDAIAQATGTTYSTRGGLIPNTSDLALKLIPQMIDPPEHTAYRQLLNSWFTPRRIVSFEPVARSMARQLIEGLESPADLAKQFALPLPLKMMLWVIGVPDLQLPVFVEAMNYMAEHAGDDLTGAIDAMQTARDFVRDQVLMPLKDNPGDDLLSFLLASRTDDGPRLDDDTIATIGVSIMTAGFETTNKTLGSSLVYLATNPDGQAAARAASSARVAEEMVRMFTPVMSGRLVLEDTEIAGRHVRKGDQVFLAWPAANRDETVIPEPDEARFDRPDNVSRAFGTGPYRCLGMHLARLELRVAFEELFKAFTEIRLQPDKPPIYRAGYTWGVMSAHFEFERAEPA